MRQQTINDITAMMREEIKHAVMDNCLLPDAYTDMDEYANHFADTVMRDEINFTTDEYEIAARYTKSGNPIVIRF